MGIIHYKPRYYMFCHGCDGAADIVTIPIVWTCFAQGLIVVQCVDLYYREFDYTVILWVRIHYMNSI